MKLLSFAGHITHLFVFHGPGFSLKKTNFKQKNCSSWAICGWCTKVTPPGVNFTNLFRAAFSYKSYTGVNFTNVLRFFILTFRFVHFLRKEIGVKVARKMLVKLTT